ncbi:MAG: TonB-dependent receptor [Pseudomonadales bacterium]|nr:TonB-dependent receptor [Pseudomonadales bacterium]
MKHKLLYCAIALTVPGAVFAQSDPSSRVDHTLSIGVLDVIDVFYENRLQPVEQELLSEALVTKPTNDAGALIRSVNGVTATRRGGLGFEPIIRGMSQNQLNVISNGAYSFGACPGRMDPPSTYVGFDSFDSVEVIKGNRSVIYGAGGSGGTMIFEHQRPDLQDGNFTGAVTGSSTSNSELNSLSVDVAFGNERSFVRVFGENSESDNYEDGNGQIVSSAYQSEDIGIIIGSDITPGDYLEVSLEQGNEDDIYYAGNSMDAPFADSESYRLKWEHTTPVGPLDSIELNMYRTDVVHLMDNYRVRPRNSLPNGMAAESESDTWGGKLMGTVELTSTTIKLGADFRANDRQAMLYMDQGKDGSYDMLVSRMWPHVEQRHSGLFAEVDHYLSSADTLRLGLRYDRFTSEARSASQSAGMMGNATPTRLYQNFYGNTETELNSNDLGVVLGWTRELLEGRLLSVNLSRSVRTPDASENFMARSAGGSFWVGNPTINPETHNQLDVTFIQRGAVLDWSASAYWNEVDDYIERYQQGNAALYRNQDASIRGLEFEAGRDFGSYLNARAALAYTRGDGDNGDLARISPLEARFIMDYTRNSWGVGAELIATDRQTHFNPAVDVADETAGYGVLNLYGHWRPSQQITLEAGAENLFDRAYAYHVNTAATDPFDPTAVRVNEPGRQFWLKARYSF